MMKTFPVLLCLFVGTALHAQKGDELLVYSMKGNVSVIENNKETKMKIGKVLKPGSAIKTQKLAKLTMVCKQGKPLSVTKEGVFPVASWKDSCYTINQTVTSKYFQYIWDQLYVRSEDYKKEHPDGEGTVAKYDAPVRGQEELEIEMNLSLDTVMYAAGHFPLSWNTNIEYNGRFKFILYHSKTGQRLYEDSISGTTILLDGLKKYMRAGQTYGWSVAAPKTEITEGGIIKYVHSRTSAQQVRKMKRSVNVPEDEAAQFFRIAYMLESNHYFADAYRYYQQAASAAPDVEFYTEKLNEFKKTFQIGNL
jgi:hypothetical protein